ncbi:GDP-4-dehydro-6-deoxy-D-mannose reductase [Rhizobiales bacterium GAS191]|nr:GDP-4-dehydro-6-deoxy-D-mannose reductase [Rhizobiales bacterium GAS113]SED41884.1 GDP-4-dehydro-6-deoxy-D-mannose reductase [Rhizobiales bacterium GAS188]SEE94085.1 GDP-4-dehydro-6-deoxy-D-mannose reductase [Rhizobiales bacterium GAS191]
MARVYSRILVTGANGFVGPQLLARLSGAFPEAKILGTGFKGGALPPGGMELDIRDAQAVDRAIASVSPDGVVHLAAISQVQQAQQSPRATFDVNFGGTLNIAEAMRRHVPQARLLFVSSSEVYGGSFRSASAPIDETVPLDPMNSYAASKAAADLLIGQMAHQGLQAIRLRPFNHTGPGQNDRFVVASFVAQIVGIERGDQEPVLRVGNLDAQRDFLDARDIVTAYAQAMAASDLTNGTVLNIASGRARRIGDILEDLLKRARVAIRILVDPARLRAVEIPVAVGDAGRARALLDWAPNIPFEQTLDEMLDAQRAKPAS